MVINFFKGLRRSSTPDALSAQNLEIKSFSKLDVSIYAVGILLLCFSLVGHPDISIFCISFAISFSIRYLALKRTLKIKKVKSIYKNNTFNISLKSTIVFIMGIMCYDFLGSVLSLFWQGEIFNLFSKNLIGVLSDGSVLEIISYVSFSLIKLIAFIIWWTVSFDLFIKREFPKEKFKLILVIQGLKYLLCFIVPFILLVSVLNVGGKVRSIQNKMNTEDSSTQENPQ